MNLKEINILPNLNGEKFLEQNSHKHQIDILEAQIREIYGRVVWSHKAQEKCADIALKIHNRIKFWQIVLSAVTTTSILITIFGKSQLGLIIGIVVSTILFGLNTYTKDYDLGEIAQKHSNAANELWNLREDYLSFLTDIKINQLSIGQIIEKRDELQSKLFNIYSGSPRTNSKAYKEATKSLKLDEELTFSEEEIDLFLPKELRRIKKDQL